MVGSVNNKMNILYKTNALLDQTLTVRFSLSQTIKDLYVTVDHDIQVFVPFMIKLYLDLSKFLLANKYNCSISKSMLR